MVIVGGSNVGVLRLRFYASSFSSIAFAECSLFSLCVYMSEFLLSIMLGAIS